MAENCSIDEKQAEPAMRFVTGRTSEADYYMAAMDGFDNNGKETDPDGQISIDEWHEFFRYMANDDTGIPETSPSACKALDSLEHAAEVK